MSDSFIDSGCAVSLGILGSYMTKDRVLRRGFWQVMADTWRYKVFPVTIVFGEQRYGVKKHQLCKKCGRVENG